MAELLGGIPDSWGPKFESAAGAVTHTQTGPNSIEFTAPSHMALVLLTPQLEREVTLNSSRKSVFSAPVGTVEIIPATADLFARWKTAKENLLIALAPDRLSTLAGLEFDMEDFEFQIPKTGFVDEKALLLARMIKDEFEKGKPFNGLYFDSLITVFSTYLLRSYSSTRDRTAQRQRGGLSAKAWRNVEDYIRANLSEELTVERLAFIAGLSPSHFLRAFRQTSGLPPHQYVLGLRIELAERLAVETDMPLGIVAKLAGFSHHSHMTSAMRRHKGTTPSLLRRLHAINKDIGGQS